ncbi:MAG: hypothetical protein HY555_02690 [Euryarchaeota archaeon]|nr:hypothetical protein [Euryarchaeota archaeon]
MEQSVRGTFFVEAHGNHKGVVKGSLEALVRGLKAEGGIKVLKESFGAVTEDLGQFSAMTELELEFQSPLHYLLGTIKYGPSAIDLQSPEELSLTAQEFVALLGEVIKVAKAFYTKYNVGFVFTPRKGRGSKGVGLGEEKIEGLLRQGAIRAKVVVELGGKSKKRVVDDFINTVSEEAFVHKVLTTKVGEAEAGEGFKGLVGVDVFFYEPKALFDLAVKYTPVLVEIKEPEEIRLSILDLQDIGVDLAAVFFEASHKLVSQGG